MTIWRGDVNRLRGFFGFRGLGPMLALLVLTLALSGCGRGLRHESWPGLMEVDGTLYAANLEHVQALNAETGKVYWDFPAEADQEIGPFYSTPVLVKDSGAHGVLLVAGFSDHSVYALALGATPAERPDELWRFSGAGGQFVGTGVVADRLYVIGNGDGNIYALDVETGAEAWVFTTHDRAWATPVVIGDVVYVASLDHHLYALDLHTGSARWQLKTPGALSATPVYAGGSIWIGDFTSTLYQVDPETGEILWTLQANDWLWPTPVVDGSTLYFADVGGNVYALNVETHQLVWDAPVSVGDVVHGRPVLVQDGKVLIVAGYEKGQLHAIDTATGDLLETWGTTLENPGRLPGDLVTDGKRIYTMPILVQERIQAFDAATGELLWSVPLPEK